MRKTTNQASSALEAKSSSDKLEFNWEKFDLKQFRKGLSAELTDGTNKGVTSCTSSAPILIDKVARAHLNGSSDYATQHPPTKKAIKREYDSKRAITQAEATARFK